MSSPIPLSLHGALETDQDISYQARNGLPPLAQPLSAGASYLVMVVGQHRLAWPLAQVRSVQRPGRFTEVPLASPWLAGVTAVHGEVVSVVDLGTFAGLERAGSGPGARLVIVQGGGITAALLVDGVERIVKAAAPPSAPPVRRGPLSEWWAGVVRLDGSLIPVLDAITLLRSPAFHAYQTA